MNYEIFDHKDVHVLCKNQYCVSVMMEICVFRVLFLFGMYYEYQVKWKVIIYIFNKKSNFNVYWTYINEFLGLKNCKLMI